MMPSPVINLLVMGASCFDGMASSTRVRNLLEPLVSRKMVRMSNLVYQTDNRVNIGKKGILNRISYLVIGFRLKNIFSIFGFLSEGMGFIRANKTTGARNIIYNYNYPDLKNIIFLLYAKMIGYKIIFDIVEDNRFEANSGFINKLRIQSSRLLFSLSRYFSSAYIALSQHLVERSNQVSQGEVPVYFVPITVNLDYFPQREYSPDKNDLKVFYGGSFGKKDGLEYLIRGFEDACKKNAMVRLVLTGAGNANDSAIIRKLVESSTCKDRIQFMGYLDTEAYYECLNNCDIFCMTRVNSKFSNAGFPFKLGEFLAAGKGVIATNVGDVSRYLVNEVNGLLIEPDSPAAISDALTEFITTPEKIVTYGKEARNTAEKFFDSEKYSLKLYDMFNTV